MTRELSPEEQKVMGFILAVFIVVASAIIISRRLFPFFLVGSMILFGVLIIVGIIEIFFRDRSNLDFQEYISVWIAGFWIIFLIGTGVTYGIGYGLGGTSFGQASLEVYYAFTGMEQELENAINDVVEQSCKSLPEESCQLLRQTAETAKTLQEVKDLADNLRKASDVADSVSSQ